MSYTPLRSGHTLDLLFPVTDNARCGVGVVAKILSIKHESSAASALKKRGRMITKRQKRRKTICTRCLITSLCRGFVMNKLNNSQVGLF